jgi:hypothetical protein
MRVPMTAREQLLRAQELGHELSVLTRTNSDYPDAPPKYWLRCTCGYSSTARRSKSALNGTMAWHLGKALSEPAGHVNGR